MAIIVRCSCGKKIRVEDKLLGKRVRCPGCGVIQVAQAPPADKPAWEKDVKQKAPPAPAAPLLWHTGQSKDNIILIAGNAVYVATVKPKLVAEVDRRLVEEGEEPEEVFAGKCQVLPFTELARLRYKQSHSKHFPDDRLDLYHTAGGKEKKLRLRFGAPANRDTFAGHLAERTGWAIHEEPVPLWSLLLQYGILLAFVIAGTALVVYLELTSRDKSGPALYYLIVDNLGIWGLIGIGAIIAGSVIALAVATLRQRPQIVTYGPAADS